MARRVVAGNVLCPGPPVCRIRHPRGERSGRAILPNGAVARMRAAYADGASVTLLAHRFGVALSTVSMIVHRQRRLYEP